MIHMSTTHTNIKLFNCLIVYIYKPISDYLTQPSLFFGIFQFLFPSPVKKMESESILAVIHKETKILLT